jgi:hypothetical protein
MTNIVKFPVKADAPRQEAAPDQAPQSKATQAKPRRNLFAPVLRFVWVLTALVWPILKWVVSIGVFFQFIRMVFHWNTPGVYAGWTFLAYFAGLVALTYFVSLYKPKGL